MPAASALELERYISVAVTQAFNTAVTHVLTGLLEGVVIKTWLPGHFGLRTTSALRMPENNPQVPLAA